MAKNPLNRIQHILEEIEVLASISRKHTLESFRSDPIDVRATAYSLQNISEAVRHLPQAWLDKSGDIPWASIKGFGNLARHEYFRIDPDILWATIASDIQPLRRAMIKLQENSGPTA